MQVVAIIVGGLVVMTGIASFFSYLTEKRKRSVPELDQRLAVIENRVNTLDAKLSGVEELSGAKDSRIEQIAEDIAFVNKLIEHNLPGLRAEEGQRRNGR